MFVRKTAICFLPKWFSPTYCGMQKFRQHLVVRRNPLLHKNQHLHFVKKQKTNLVHFGNKWKMFWIIFPTVKLEGGSIMLWGSIAASSTSNISSIEGRMDSIEFQQILDTNITPVKKLKLKWRGLLKSYDGRPRDRP